MTLSTTVTLDTVNPLTPCEAEAPIIEEAGEGVPALAALPASNGTFLVRFAGFSTLIGAPLLGFVAGEHLAYLRRRRENRPRNLVLLVLISAAFVLLIFLIESRVPPLIGQSESRWLFPWFFGVGVIGGFLGSLQKFKQPRIRPKRK
jgi:hypothetical protein